MQPAPITKNSPRPAAGEPLLSARDLWFSYPRGGPVLKGVDLDVPRGQMTMVLGKSGSGKTTLLRALKGLVTPQKGTVSIAGPGCADRAAKLRRAVAYVPQNLGLVRGMTALENVLAGSLGEMGLWRTLFHSYLPEAIERARKLLDDLELSSLEDEKVRRLSGGERQRVAIARALMLEPELILADEFVSQLDAVTTRKILDHMKGLQRRGLTFLITTHEIEIVAHYAKRLVIMSQGDVTYCGGPSALSEEQIIAHLR